MSNLNCVVLEGHLTKQAEMGYFQDQTPYCNFSIAVNDSWKNPNGEYESIASFIECTMKGKYAEAMCKHLTKGRALRVLGRLKQNRWQKDGQNYSKLIVKVQEIYLSPLNNNQESGNYSKPNYQNNSNQNYQASQNYESYSEPAESEPDFIPFDDGGNIPF